MEKVMVVDDCSFMRTFLRKILKENGYDVVTEAKDGCEAIEQYKLCKPDIAIIDIIMPGKNGFEVSKKILEYDTKAKIILMSSLSQKKYVIEALRLGAKNYLPKPFNEKEILLSLNIA